MVVVKQFHRPAELPSSLRWLSPQLVGWRESLSCALVTLPQLVHWVTLLIDPASSGPYGDGDIDIQADMLQKLGKQGQPPGEVVVMKTRSPF